MAKTRVVYDHWDPNDKKVRFVAIQAMSKPPRVYYAYYGRDYKNLPGFNDDMSIIPIEAARELFDFQPVRRRAEK